MRRRSATSPSPPSAAASGHWRSGSAWSCSTGRPFPVRLTAQGEQFLPVARDIVDRMAEARREFAAGNRSDGIVRLISLPTLSINVLPDLLFRVRQTCDQLRFVVNPFPQSVEEHFCALMEHQVDMLLTYRLDEYESDSEFLSHIESATVGRERFLPVVGSALAERLPSASPCPTFPTAISPSPTGSSFRFTKRRPANSSPSMRAA